MKKILFISLSVISFSILIFAFSPAFQIRRVVLNNGVSISESDVCKVISPIDKNIFLFNTKSAKEKLLTNPLIESVHFKRILPDELEITLSERTPVFYIKYMDNTFLLIDEKGRVLSVSETSERNLPFVSGLQYDTFILGKELKLDNSVLEIAVQISILITRYEITEHVTIDVSNLKELRLLVNQLDVVLGDSSMLNDKISTLKAILDSDFKMQPGVLYLNDKKPLFKLLT